ncbi:MAG: VOC family protein [Myxococcota bacterium]
MLAAVPKSMDHVTLLVGSLDAAKAFYVDLLGATLESELDADTFRRYVPDRAAEADNLENSPLHLSIRFAHGPRLDLFLSDRYPRSPRPHPHLAFGVSPQALDGCRDALNAAGVVTDGPRRLGPPGQASLYFSDPFGNLLELVAMGYPRPIPVGPPDLAALAPR